ncbi:reverse transcriptase domain-containing protein [Tanacetum coccineum]
MTFELAKRAICTPAGITRDDFVPVGKFTFPTDFVIVDYESDPRVPLILGRPFLRTARALIDVHEEEMILRDVIVILGRIKAPLFISRSESSPPGNSNPSSLLPPFHNSLSGSTTSSSPSLPISEISNYFLEEFADELAHITFLPGNDDLPFDVKSDLREIKYLLNHDPIKEKDFTLEDSVDKRSLDNNLVDTISERFTDEHAPDYLSPPLWDDYDDELFDLKPDNDYVYDDPFDFKEEKIIDSKILIDELDLPESSDFLPFPEYDSVFYEDFSKDDALSSTNNEGKDLDPPLSLYELLSHKEVPGLGALHSFQQK